MILVWLVAHRRRIHRNYMWSCPLLVVSLFWWCGSVFSFEKMRWKNVKWNLWEKIFNKETKKNSKMLEFVFLFIITGVFVDMIKKWWVKHPIMRPLFDNSSHFTSFFVKYAIFLCFALFFYNYDEYLILKNSNGYWKSYEKVEA